MKRWLRAGGRVEFVGSDRWQQESIDQRRSEPRSLIRELLRAELPEEKVEELEIAPGRWLLPGTVP